jgi:hypothetical protein
MPELSSAANIVVPFVASARMLSILKPQEVQVTPWSSDLKTPPLLPEPAKIVVPQVVNERIFPPMGPIVDSHSALAIFNAIKIKRESVM